MEYTFHGHIVEGVQNLNPVKVEVMGQDIYDTYYDEGPPSPQVRRMAYKASHEDYRSPRTLGKETAKRTFQTDKGKKV